MVSVEFSMGLISLSAVTLLFLAIVQAVLALLGTHEAARSGARMAGLGEDSPAIVAAAHQSMPGSHVEIERDGGLVTVVVRAPDQGLYGRLGLDIEAEASVVAEPGGGGSR